MQTQENIVTHNEVEKKNKEMVRKAVDKIWNKADYSLMKEMLDDDFVIHSLDPQKELRGFEAVKQFYTQIRNSFPDIKFTITDQLADGDKVVTHWIAEGTHKGEFAGAPPTGKKFKVSAIDIDTIKDGKFTECWTNMDELGLLQQLGLAGNGNH